jgi:hypothetical protein
MKSKYPNQVDTSAEIPVVRDGITEISSEFFNSLRSAIIQIEKTLGVNPQGAVGLTVGDRISNSLDSSGNLSKEALDKANVIYGPIIDDNISQSASISESKLKLNFPTNVLQSQISTINSLIDGIVLKIDELNILFSAHINPNATGRHYAKSILVESYTQSSSDLATTSFEQSSLQTFAENLYSKHINYSGASISPTNNSHLASQIYFDSQPISDLTSSSDVQTAIEDIASLNSESIRDNFSYLNSNAQIRFGRKKSLFEGNDKNLVIIPAIEVIYSISSTSVTKLTLSAPTLPTQSISKFDLVRLAGTLNSVDDGEYYVESFEMDGSNISTISIFAQVKTDSSGSATISVFKNSYENNNFNGLNTTVRPRFNYTNTPDIVVAHPNAASIISFGFDSSNITALNNKIKILVDGELEQEFETFDSTLSEDSQNIDSVVYKLNTQFVENKFPVMAYKVRRASCYELALTHIVPDLSGDIKQRSLKLSVAADSDGTSSLGFSSKLDITYYGANGNPVLLNGNLLKDFYKILSFDNTTAYLNPSSQRISLNSGVFSSYGVAVGDTVVVSGATDSNDDGAFRILNVDAQNIDLDLTSFTFSGSLNETSIIYIIKNSIPLYTLNFEEVSETSGFSLVDSLMDINGFVFFNKRAEISSPISSSSIFASIIDMSAGYLIDDFATLTIDTNGDAFITDSNLTDGEKVTVTSNGIFNIPSPDRINYLTIRVNYTSLPLTALSSVIYGKQEHKKDVYHLSRSIFGNSLGRVFGFPTSVGAPNLIDKRTFGNIDINQISPNFIEKYIEGPRNELRSSGIITGCSVTGITRGTDAGGDYVSFGVSAGIAIVNGIRYIFSGIESFRHYTLTNFYVAIDRFGCLDVRDEISESYSSYKNQSVAFLAYIRNIESIYVPSINGEEVYDLRYFVNNIDSKISKEIIVSNNQSDSHFTDIESAVKYAGFYSRLFPNVSYYSPKVVIREGEYEVNSPILIDFDLTVVGSGTTSLVKRGDALSIGTTYNTSVNFDVMKSIFIIGGGEATSSDRIIRGVMFKDISYKTNDSFSGTAPVFCITQDLSSDGNNPYFRFENIYFEGPQDFSANPAGTPVFENPIVATHSTAGSFPTDVIFGNIIMTGCYFNYMGSEDGIIKVVVDQGASSNSTVQNIIATNNIAVNSAPDGYIPSPKMIYDNYTSYVTVSNLIESSNAITI